LNFRVNTFTLPSSTWVIGDRSLLPAPQKRKLLLLIPDGQILLSRCDSDVSSCWASRFPLHDPGPPWEWIPGHGQERHRPESRLTSGAKALAA
jgi:hypothetical protein